MPRRRETHWFAASSSRARSCGVTASSAMACYAIYDSKNEMVYDKFEAPVNMRQQLHDTVPVRVPGGHMVFSTQSTNCSGIDQLSNKPAAPAVSTAA